MAHQELCCGLFRGSIYLKDTSDANAALLPVGNAEISITQTLTEITQPNYQSLGGNACKVAYPETIGMELTMHCTNPTNLAIAFMGDAYQKTAGSVTDEQHVVHAEEELIDFVNVPDVAYTITVTSEDGLTTYVKDTDYSVTQAGIVILEGTTIVMGSTIQVSYQYGANWVIDAQTVAQKTFYVVLDGVNVGEDGQKPVVLKAWRVKFNPTETFALISGTEFASLALTGEILRDDSKSVGSKFFKIEASNTNVGSY